MKTNWNEAVKLLIKKYNRKKHPLDYNSIYELMVMNEEIAHKIMERASSPTIVAVARKHGLRLLREDGWVKVHQGQTTPDEVVMCTAL